MVITTDALFGAYFIIGLVYCLINGLVRKVDTDGDWLLPIVWLTLWPLGILSLLVAGIIGIFKRKPKTHDE
jgi:formate hydrogenlyase subunit 3/multisubunit Na+/H+ antiporter MnhD subunit